MTIGMYSASVPIFQRQLRALGNVLDKGAAFAAAKKMQDAVVMQLRLYPDMLPLGKQVQIEQLHLSAPARSRSTL